MADLTLLKSEIAAIQAERDALRTEIERLKVELHNAEQIRDTAIGRLKAGGLEAEIERLRAALGEIAEWAIAAQQFAVGNIAREALANDKRA